MQMVDVVCTDVAENALPTPVFERDRFGGGSVMVWGGIAHGIKSVDYCCGQYDCSKV